MMWAVIGTILVVVVALVLWGIFSGAAATVNAPQVQLVAQESFIIGNTANVTLQFGKGLQGVSISMAVPSGSTVTSASTSCTPTGVNVAEGQKVSFRCTLGRSLTGVAYILVRWTGGSTTIKWVVG
ncbi:MAG: hypothetical protein GU356_09180 [Pyrobaculum sp.]|nr:hypothetical protein [Pyrobaculum sp.]